MSEPRDILIELFEKEGLQYLDNRPKGGHLWVIGGKELEPLIEKVSEEIKAPFTFVRNGCKASGFRPAWFTKAKSYLKAANREEAKHRAHAEPKPIIPENTKACPASKKTEVIQILSYAADDL